MAEKTPPKKYVRADEFFESPVPSDIAEVVREQVLRERKEAILDLATVREQEKWSLLANKIVGAEGA